MCIIEFMATIGFNKRQTDLKEDRLAYDTKNFVSLNATEEEWFEFVLNIKNENGKFFSKEDYLDFFERKFSDQFYDNVVNGFPGKTSVYFALSNKLNKYYELTNYA